MHIGQFYGDLSRDGGELCPNVIIICNHKSMKVDYPKVVKKNIIIQLSTHNLGGSCCDESAHLHYAEMRAIKILHL